MTPMIPRSDRPVHIGVAFIILGPAVVALMALLGLWLMEGLVDQVFRDVFAASDKLTAGAGSKQILAWILGLMVNGVIGVAIFCGMLLLQLWMISVLLLLILHELSGINEMKRR